MSWISLCMVFEMVEVVIVEIVEVMVVVEMEVEGGG